MFRRYPYRLAAALLSFSAAASTFAQRPSPRITTAIDSASRVSIPGTRPAAARPANDAGRMPVSTELKGMSIVFARSAAQEAALQALLVAQQDPSSSQYHRWLTPEQFAAQFGMADSDIAKVQGWLVQQGFAVDGVARSRNSISFSGSVAQAEKAFGTEMHYFWAEDATNFAPAGDLSLPSAIAPTVQAVNNLTDFRPKPHVRLHQGPQSNFTSSSSGNHFLTPKDIATIYDINAAYNAGFTGAGQSIAVVGQSAIVNTDITRFQTAAGLTPNAPTSVLMPGTGVSTIYTGDQAESDLDVEYSGGIAKGATIFFVYTGSSTNYGVFDALQYAITEKIAPILSISYGTCETNLSATRYASLNAFLAQAASQGQSVFSASGDAGSTDCSTSTNLTTAQRSALAVDFPASSQYVTGLGGTEFPAASVATTNSTYWTPASGADVIGSALSYIPEVAWNDSTASNASSSGGGTSAMTARPSWQTGVAGIASGSFRLVPDVSLTSSPVNAGYLYCSSDTTAWTTNQTSSCSSGFRDSSSQILTVAGGTSFAAPIFAGMMAIINQSRNSTGQGLVNPTLYTLAANATTYASAFHDTTSGTNACVTGGTYCTPAGAASYSATTGYDQATGLGSVDLYNLLLAWPKTSASALAGSTVTLSAATTSPVAGASDVISITVAPSSALLSTSPTGTLTVLVDGVSATTTLALSGGKATYTFSSTVAGAHVVTVTYSGDSVYAGSTSAISLNVGATTATGGSFSVSATNVSVAAGSTGVSTITVTPTGGYTGTVTWTISSSSTLTNTCYTISNLTVTGTAAATTALTFSTSSSACSNGSVVRGSGSVAQTTDPQAGMSGRRFGSFPSSSLPAGFAVAGLLMTGMYKRRSRKGWCLLPGLMLGVCGLALSGCSNSVSSTSTSANASKGTYTVTVVGRDTSTSTITASTTLTLVIN